VIETDNQRLLEWGRKTLLEEGNAVLSLLDSLGTSYCELVRLILRCKGKIVFTGLGKSGYVAQKLAATFSSTGTHAFYLHPSEALHGDFGMIKEGDTLFALAHSGETREV
jgi:D-arabinose 5-phosphate isomerase GutQ